eukprot:PhF_6_TR31828/c1_g2_i4/m.47070
MRAEVTLFKWVDPIEKAPSNLHYVYLVDRLMRVIQTEHLLLITLSPKVQFSGARTCAPKEGQSFTSYWNDTHVTDMFPRLSFVARRAGEMIASEASCERVFSQQKNGAHGRAESARCRTGRS